MDEHGRLSLTRSNPYSGSTPINHEFQNPSRNEDTRRARLGSITRKIGIDLKSLTSNTIGKFTGPIYDCYTEVKDLRHRPVSKNQIAKNFIPCLIKNYKKRPVLSTILLFGTSGLAPALWAGYEALRQSKSEKYN